MPTETTVGQCGSLFRRPSENIMIHSATAIEAAAHSRGSASTTSMLSEQDCQHLIETSKNSKKLKFNLLVLMPMN